MTKVALPPLKFLGFGPSGCVPFVRRPGTRQPAEQKFAVGGPKWFFAGLWRVEGPEGLGLATGPSSGPLPPARLRGQF